MRGSILLEREDREMLADLPEVPEGLYRSFSRPAEVLLDDIKRENQSSMGSCQGHSITTCVERLLNVGGRYKGTQLSRIYAYLASQQIDGLLGNDHGSTISSGIKVALKGMVLETECPYPVPAVYPSRSKREAILGKWSEEGTAPYKALSSWKVPVNTEKIKDFIGGGGAINIGIKWYSGIIPRNRLVTRYSPPSRSGGHAISILGYKANGNLLFMNSHGDGQFEVTPAATISMLQDSWTAAIGIKGTDEPHPVDWLNDSPLWGG